MTLELATFWHELRQGIWRFHDTFSTTERCYAIIRRELEPRALDARKVELLERLLLGTPVKVIAFERHRSLSSITTGVHDCLRAMGLTGRASYASVLLTMSATAAHRPDLSRQRGRVSQLQFGNEEYTVISAARPDLEFPVELSIAEAAVVRCLVSGQSYAQISGERATSQRTVANQLATAFRKLGVSGRRATIERLLQHSAQLA
jgi:DNA-binding NarL/FixJ family response regulator